MSPEQPPGPRARPSYDLEIQHLKDRAAAMGEWSLGMVHDGWIAFEASDLEAAQKVLDRGAGLDGLDDDMEHAAIAFMVLRQPTAVDLRTAAALLKSTTHLDRIGRLGFDMDRITTPGSGEDSADLRRLLEQMDTIVEGMVRQSIDAMSHDRVDLARQLFRQDDQVDSMHREANRKILEQLGRAPAKSQRLANDLLVARHFERIADNACKVGEKTIYAITGQRRSEYLPRHSVVPYVLETRPKSGTGGR